MLADRTATLNTG